MSTMKELQQVIGKVVGDNIAVGVVKGCIATTGVDPDHLRHGEDKGLLAGFENGLKLWVREPRRLAALLKDLEGIINAHTGKPAAALQPVVIKIQVEADIVFARGKASALCGELGFGLSVQVRMATLVSELARNVIQYAGTGTIKLVPHAGNRPGIEIIASDRGPGIDKNKIEEIMSGRYKSRSGMGMGLQGAKKLSDTFEIESAPGEGTEIRARKYLR